MKTNLLLILAGTFLVASVRADLLVYRESERALVTTVGREVKVPVTTYLVYDTVTHVVDAVGAFKVGANRYYAITNTSTYIVQQGIPGASGSYTVLARVTTTNSDPNNIASGYFAKGRESNLDLGNGNSATFPRSMKAVTRSLMLSSGQIAFYESSSTLVFQTTETKAANSAGDAAATVIERIRQRLVAQGYVPSP